ncbi:hypothetical protein DVJ78_16705 [Humibacter sp. BT305]|nr:hypothetical protein DVJ78_16705 [Humibacter sp. BT305]
MRRLLCALLAAAAVVGGAALTAPSPADARRFDLDTTWSGFVDERADVLAPTPWGGAYVIDNTRGLIRTIDEHGVVSPNIRTLPPGMIVSDAVTDGYGDTVLCGQGNSGMIAISRDGRQRDVVPRGAALGLAHCAVDSRGNIVFSRPDAGALGRIDRFGSLDLWWASLPTGWEPLQISIAGDDSVYTWDRTNTVSLVTQSQGVIYPFITSAHDTCAWDFDATSSALYVTDPCRGGVLQYNLGGALVRTISLPAGSPQPTEAAISDQGNLFLRASGTPTVWQVPSSEPLATEPTVRWDLAGKVTRMALLPNDTLYVQAAGYLHRIDPVFDIWPDTGAAASVSAPYTDRYFTDSPFWVTLSVSGGALPPGLTLDGPTGILSGTPTRAGTYTFDLTADNVKTKPITKTFTVVVNP